MDTMSGPMEITVYELPTPEVMRAAVARSYLAHRMALPRRHLGSVAAAAIFSITLHALFFDSFWSRAASASRPRPAGAESSSQVPGDDVVMTMILFNAPSYTKLDHDIPMPQSLGRLSQRSPVILVSPDLLPGIDADLSAQASDAQSAATDDLATQATRAKLYARYTGQIKARIERAWVRPRTAPGGSLFTCRVQIVQARNGDVRETTLQRCDGNVQWQQSLVDAIQAASPLPAPPAPEVYTDAVTLEFRSLAFAASKERDGFAAPNPTVAAASAQPMKGLQRRMHASGIINLTIQGSNVSVTDALTKSRGTPNRDDGG